jgi:hypothetical protein
MKPKATICAISLILAGILSSAFVAQARDRTNALDRAAALVSRCIAEQSAAELGKGTTTAQFEIVLIDKCRTQEGRFKKALIAHLKKEGSLNSRTVRAVDELLEALRQRAVSDYGDTMRLPERLVNRQIRA